MQTHKLLAGVHRTKKEATKFPRPARVSDCVSLWPDVGANLANLELHMHERPLLEPLARLFSAALGLENA